MGASYSAVKFTPTAGNPNPNGAGLTVLFATQDATAGTAVAGWSKHLTSETGIHRTIWNIQTTDNSGSSFILQKSRDRGVTWRTVSTTAVAGSTTNNTFDVVVEGLPDWRVVWSNGAANQLIFEADGAFVDSRSATT